MARGRQGSCSFAEADTEGGRVHGLGFGLHTTGSQGSGLGVKGQLNGEQQARTTRLCAGAQTRVQAGGSRIPERQGMRSDPGQGHAALRRRADEGTGWRVKDPRATRHEERPRP
eukprot:352020-Chlamydomonas_euryale.AAC.1